MMATGVNRHTYLRVTTAGYGDTASCVGSTWGLQYSLVAVI